MEYGWFKNQNYAIAEERKTNKNIITLTNKWGAVTFNLM